MMYDSLKVLKPFTCFGHSWQTLRQKAWKNRVRRNGTREATKRQVRNIQILEDRTLLAGAIDFDPLVTGDLSVYYNFDSFESTILDGSGNGNNSSVIGDVTSVEGLRDGVARFAPVVGSVSQNYLVLDGPDFPVDQIPTDAFTVAAWVNVAQTGNRHGIFETRSADGSFTTHAELWEDGRARLALRNDNGTDPAVTIVDFVMGEFAFDEWFHYAATYDQASNVATLYINGNEVATGPALQNLPIAGDWGLGARIGATTDNARPFTGMMDEFYLFTRALSIDEIQVLASDTYAPSIISITPSDGSVLLENLSSIDIQLNEAIDPALILSDAIVLVEAGAGGVLGDEDDVPITLSEFNLLDNDKLIRISTNALPAGIYELRIQEHLISDMAGNAIGDGVFTSEFELIQQEIPLVSGDLSLYFSFNTVGTNVVDHSGNEHIAQLVGDVTGSSGLYGGGVRFEGTNPGFNYIDLDGPNFPAEQIPTDAMTIAAWVNLQQTSNRHGLFATRAGDGTFSTHAELLPDGLARFTLRGASSETIINFNTGVIPFDEWFHYAATFDLTDNLVTLYINGEIVAESPTLTQVPIASDWDLGATLGATVDHNSTRQFTGEMDEFYLFTRALSDAEVQILAADYIPPQVVSVDISKSGIYVQFSEPMSLEGDLTGEHSILNPENWSLQNTRTGNTVNINRIELLDDNSVQLSFNIALPNGDYLLTVKETIHDANGNALDGDGDGFAGGDYLLYETFVFFDPLVTGELSVYYNFDSFDSILLDGSGNGNNSSVVGDVTPTGVLRDGVARFAPVAGSVSQNYLVLDGPDFPADQIPTDAFTVAAWVNVAQTGYEHGIFETRSADGSFTTHAELWEDGRARLALRNDNGADPAVTIVDLVMGDFAFDEWFHYAATYDQASNVATLYINGNEVATGQALQNLPIAGDWGLGARIGATTDNARPFTGMMDEFYLFTRALSTDEIQVLASDFIPPQVIDADITRTGVLVEFSEAMSVDQGAAGEHSIFNPNNWSLFNINTDQLVVIEDVVLADTNTAFLTFNTSLANGEYLLTARETIQDASGNALDGDGDGFAGGIYQQSVLLNQLQLSSIEGLGVTLAGSPLISVITGDGVRVSGDGSIIVGTRSINISGENEEEAFRWTDENGVEGLGDLAGGDFHSAASVISADGSLIIGISETSTSLETFRWTNDTGIERLDGFTGASYYSRPYSVSADGSVIVGIRATYDYSGQETIHEAFRWTDVKGIELLGDFPGGGYHSVASRVSADGSVIVGYGSSANGREAFRWTAENGMEGLGSLEGFDYISIATGVSADGSVIVGYSSGVDGTNAFRWTAENGMEGLGDLAGGDFYSIATGISADGSVIVGYSDVVDGANGWEAFRWTTEKGMEGLGDLPGGEFFSVPFGGISADGSVIVGYSNSANGQEAFRWTADKGMEGLGDLAGAEFFSHATGVSADGSVIVGYSQSANGREVFRWKQSPPKVLNVVTHGWNPSPVIFDWEAFRAKFHLLADEFEKLPAPGSVLENEIGSYVTEWDSSTGWIQAAANVGMAFLLPEEMSEAALDAARFWMDQAEFLAESTAKRIVSEITTNPSMLQDPSAGQVINLIGHSRGAAVNARVSELLVSKGYTVDQYTSLDGYSTDWPFPSGILGDISIAGTTNAEKKVNYRVEEAITAGILELVIESVWPFDLAEWQVELLGALTPDDWKAPLRELSGFEDITILGTGDTDPVSHHLNVTDLYLDSKDREHPNAYIRDDYNYILERHHNRNTAGQSAFLDAVGTEAVPEEPNAERNDFNDGGFEELGDYWQQVNSFTDQYPDDELVQAWLAMFDTPQEVLDMIWETSGDLQFVFDDNDVLVELTQTADTSLSQSVLLDDNAAAVMFDLSITSAGTGDVLEVLLDDQVLTTLDLTTLAAQQRHLVSLGDFAEDYGTISFRLAGPTDVPAVIRLDNVTVVESGLAITDNSGALGDASVQFGKALLLSAMSTEDQLVRNGMTDQQYYIDLTNSSNTPLTLFEIEVNAPDVTIDLILTADAADDIVLAPGATQRINLVYAPTSPTAANPIGQDFSNPAGLVIHSDANSAATLMVGLQGKSTYASDINFDGNVNFGDLGILNATFGLSSGEDGYNPVLDIVVDGIVNFADLGILNVEFGSMLTSPVGQTVQSTLLKQASIVTTDETPNLQEPTQPVMPGLFPLDATTTVTDSLLAEDEEILTNEIARRMHFAPQVTHEHVATNSILSEFDAVYEELGRGGGKADAIVDLFDFDDQLLDSLLALA